MSSPALSPRQSDLILPSSSLEVPPRVIYTSPTEKHIVPLNGKASDHGGGHDRISNLITGLSLGGALMALSPTLIRRIAKAAGNGEVIQTMDFLSGGCCPVVKSKNMSFAKDRDGNPTYGIAGALSAKLGHIPHKLGMFDAFDKALENVNHPLGDVLRREEAQLAILGGGLTLIGHVAGDWLGKVNRTAGRLLTRATQAVGVMFTLPALLPGVGHAILTTSTLLGIDQVDRENYTATGPGVTLAAILGKGPGEECWMEQGKANTGAIGGGALALCCGLPAILSALPGIINPLLGRGGNQPEEGRGR